MARRKEKYTQRLLLKVDVLLLLLQELHGDRHAQKAALVRMGANHSAWSSAMATSGAGGVAILVSHRIMAAATTTTTYEVIPGRILGLQLQMRDETMLTIFVIHNERLCATDRKAMEETIRTINPDDQARPLEREASVSHDPGT